MKSYNRHDVGCILALVGAQKWQRYDSALRFSLIFALLLGSGLTALESLIVNVSRQGLIFIPAMFLLGALLGETGLIWAQPVADVLSLPLAAALYRRPNAAPPAAARRR